MPAEAEGLSRRSKQVLATFGAGGRRGRRHVATLRRVIESTPRLTSQINDAVTSGRLRRLERLAPGANAAGQYLPNTATIQLPVDRLKPSYEPELVFTLGHEVQHALNSLDVDRSVRDFYQRVYAVSQTGHDYTGAIKRLVDPMRLDMASLTATRYQVEQNGISLGPGANQPPVPYIDTSTRPPASGHFHHTIATHRHVPLGGAGPGQQDQLVPGTPSASVRLAHLSFARAPQRGAQSPAGPRAAAHAPSAARAQFQTPSVDNGRH